MKKIFQAIVCVFAVISAAYGAYILVNKFFRTNGFKEITEFDDLYNEYMASHSN